MSKILVVDDEPNMVDIIKIVLKNEGHEIIEAFSGSECIEKTKREKPDLIILDIRMPEMDGWTTLRKLKEMKLLKGTKVIIVTVEKGPGVEIFGLQDLVADYLTKPFDRKLLVEVVKETLK